MPLHVGFTGTRIGMSESQQAQCRLILTALRDGQSNSGDNMCYFHHGDCLGADEEAHDIALGLSYLIIIHPPSDNKARAYVHGAYEVHVPIGYLHRNHAIVAASQLILAAPKEMKRPRNLRGQGTWTTIGYAQQAGKPVLLLTR